jgi:uncharacterized protein YndB with AHSA1/START domain
MPASNTSASATSPTTDRELIFTRVFDAPRDLVFKAWTDPRHIMQWWGPKGFTTSIYEMDVRPGGVWRLTMRGPDGVDYKNRIVFLEVVKPERLVFKHEPDEESEPVGHETTVTFAKEGAKTRLTMRLLFPSAAVREHVVKKYGAVEGASQTLGKLAEYLQIMAPGANTRLPELVMTRVFDAPRDLVFKAWTDAKRLKHWWGPNGFTNALCELDPRPGGIVRIHMRAPDGTVYPNEGTVQEIVPPELLVLAMGVKDQQGNIILEGVSSVTFTEQAGKTTLTLRARITKATTEVAAMHIAGMEQGWSQSLDHLTVELAAQLATASKEHAS